MPSFALSPPVAKGGGDIAAGDPAGRSRDKLVLGSLAEAGPRRKLWLDISGEQVVSILGKRGTGKSYTLGVLAEGLAAGPGPTPIAVHTTQRAALVLDLMDIFWSTKIPLVGEGSAEIKKQYSVLEKSEYRSQSLNVSTWLPAGYERLDIDPPGVRVLRIGASDLEIDDWGALFDINMLTEPRGMLLTDTINRVSRQGYAARSGARIAPKAVFNVDDLLRCLEEDQDIAHNYNENTIRSARQRLETFGDLPLFQGEPTKLSQILQRGQLSVLMLARVPDQIKVVLVSTLLRRIMRERRDASFAQKRIDLQSALPADEHKALEDKIASSIPRSWVLLDEAHVLAGGDTGSVARDALIKYAKEGRNYGLSLALATQQPSAVDSRLMSQVETLIVHQLTSPKDAQVALDNLRSPIPDEIRVDGAATQMDALLRQLTPGTVAFSCGNAPGLPRVCIATIRPRISAHGGYEA